MYRMCPVGKIAGLSRGEWMRDESNPTENCPLPTAVRALIQTFTQVLDSHSVMPQNEI